MFAYNEILIEFFLEIFCFWWWLQAHACENHQYFHVFRLLQLVSIKFASFRIYETIFLLDYAIEIQLEGTFSNFGVHVAGTCSSDYMETIRRLNLFIGLLYGDVLFRRKYISCVSLDYCVLAQHIHNLGTRDTVTLSSS